MAYETFAFIYDEVMDETLYQQWLAFSKRHLQEDTKKYFGTGMRYWSISGCLCKRWI